MQIVAKRYAVLRTSVSASLRTGPVWFNVLDSIILQSRRRLRIGLLQQERILALRRSTLSLGLVRPTNSAPANCQSTSILCAVDQADEHHDYCTSPASLVAAPLHIATENSRRVVFAHRRIYVVASCAFARISRRPRATMYSSRLCGKLSACFASSTAVE